MMLETVAVTLTFRGVVTVDVGVLVFEVSI